MSATVKVLCYKSKTLNLLQGRREEHGLTIRVRRDDIPVASSQGVNEVGVNLNSIFYQIQTLIAKICTYVLS